MGERWGYSTTLPAEVAEPVPGRAEVPQPRRRDDDRDRVREREPDKEAASKENTGGDEKGDEKDDKEAPAKAPMPRWKKILFWLIGLAILAVLITAGVLYWLHARHFENTDDAFIDGHMSQVSAQVAAKVTRLAIGDNQVVQQGQLLLELDPRDFQVKVDQALAQRAQAVAQVQQAKAQLLVQQASLDQAEAQVRVSEADLGQQEADLKRYRAIDPKAITRQQLDTSTAQTKSAAARLDASKQAVEGGRAQVVAQQAQIAAAEANLQVADVGVESAKLQLSYATVPAPQAGRVAKRTVEVGNYVSPGQSLLAIVPDGLWVTANFKETQLTDMRVGQAVRVSIDACPDKEIPAHVDSFQSGTGAVFSSLPAENATGNYVKVVQRVPVKIAFDHPTSDGRVDGCRIAPGLSVQPRVTVR